MRTLVVYATKYGGTEKCAKLLSERLTGEVDMYNIKLEKDIDLSKYDKVIIGSSVYAGRIRKEINEFATNKTNELAEKKLAIFQCCMSEGEGAMTQMENAFPKNLVDNTIAKGSFGGEFSFDKMNFFEKLIIKMVTKNDEKKEAIDTKKNISNISEEKISEFALKVNNA